MSASAFKTAAQNNDLNAFYALWDQPNNLTLKLEALRWACAFDRDAMIDCIIDSNELNNTDVTVAFKEATKYKSLNAIGLLLRWCKWGNRFQQERIGLPSPKYINEIGCTAILSDWSAVFVAQKPHFQTLSFADLSHLYFRGVREGAVECLMVIDNGGSLDWYASFRVALSSSQSKSMKYLMEKPCLFDQEGQHKQAVKGLAHLLMNSHLFMNPQALDCAITLMEFVSPHEVRAEYDNFSEPRLSEVLDKVASMYEKKLLEQAVINAVEQKDLQTTKRKI